MTHALLKTILWCPSIFHIPYKALFWQLINIGQFVREKMFCTHAVTCSEDSTYWLHHLHISTKKFFFYQASNKKVLIIFQWLRLWVTLYSVIKQRWQVKSNMKANLFDTDYKTLKLWIQEMSTLFKAPVSPVTTLCIRINPILICMMN